MKGCLELCLQEPALHFLAAPYDPSVFPSLEYVTSTAQGMDLTAGLFHAYYDEDDGAIVSWSSCKTETRRLAK
jgi:hypothetical protein